MQNYYFRVWVYEDVQPNIFHFFFYICCQSCSFLEKTRVKFSHKNYGLFIHKYIKIVKRLFANGYFSNYDANTTVSFYYKYFLFY